MTNQELIQKYPFLQVTNPYGPGNWTDCWLDDLEPGWRIAFGEQLCEELSQAIKADNCEDRFEILEIKEKYAGLRLYAIGCGPETEKVIAKYEELSKYICGTCGQVATKITLGWYYPVCDNCKNYRGSAKPIWEWYGFKSQEDLEQEIENIKNNFRYERYRRVGKCE